MSATARSTQEASSLIRSTVDEVREVAPGSNLGPATMVKGKPRPDLVFRRQFSAAIVGNTPYEFSQNIRWTTSPPITVNCTLAFASIATRSARFPSSIEPHS